MSAAVYRRNPKVEESPLQGDLMLFDPDRGQFFVLNRTMAHVWRCCDGALDLSEVVASVGRSFADTGAANLQSDTAAALEQLLQLGLVAQSSAPTTAQADQEAVT